MIAEKEEANNQALFFLNVMLENQKYQPANLTNFTKNKANAQPPVEDHKDQHKKIGDSHLNEVEKSLNQMTKVENTPLKLNISS